MTQPFILLADSERRFEVALGPHLRASGFRFASASSTKEARSVTVVELPALLVVDLDRNPRDAVRLIADLTKRAPHLRILWVSARVAKEEIDKVRSSGAHGLLWKDTDGPTTIRAIRTILGGEDFFEEDQPTRKSSGVRALSMDQRIDKLMSG